MCGAGTIVIEAAMQAMALAPGGERAFAMERWPLAADAAVASTLTALRDEARAAARAPGATPEAAPIIGSDRDARMIESARRNAERAGVSARVTLACHDADAARPPAPTGLVITNPPYGHRLGDPRAAARGYRDLGRMLRAHFRGWRAAIVTPARLDGERQLGIRTTHTATRFPLRNGGLSIVLHVFDGRLTQVRRRRPCPCRVRIRAAPPWCRTASGSCRVVPLPRPRAPKRAS
jgi:23S rRNA (guanine2445-N2)-methyltransferase / 23S rRNA (guanine2069-N7)-methyltransferase